MINRYALIGLNLLTALILLAAVVVYQNGIFGPTDADMSTERAVDPSPAKEREVEPNEQ